LLPSAPPAHVTTVLSPMVTYMLPLRIPFTAAVGCVIRYVSPLPGPASMPTNTPLLSSPGPTRTVVPLTRAAIWSMPETRSPRAGHTAWNALTGGWCETCSVRNAMRTRARSGAVTSPSSSAPSSSPSSPPSSESAESPAATLVGAVLALAAAEPLRVLAPPLRALRSLFTLAPSPDLAGTSAAADARGDGAVDGAAGEATKRCWIGGSAGSLG
jgi:hypothetical protein